MATLLWNPYASYQTYRPDPNQMTYPPVAGPMNSAPIEVPLDISTINKQYVDPEDNSMPIPLEIPTTPVSQILGGKIQPITRPNPPVYPYKPKPIQYSTRPVSQILGGKIRPITPQLTANQAGRLNPPVYPYKPKPIEYSTRPVSEILGGKIQPITSSGTTGGSTGTSTSALGDAYSNMTDTQKLTFGTEAVVGGVNLAVDAGSIASQRLGLGKPSTMFYEEGVNPVYRTGDYFNRAFYARPMGATGAEVASTGLKTAATGSKLGMMLGGPAGAAVGAAAGAVLGAGTALVAGGVRKRRQQREKNRALNLARGQQADYNTRALDFSQQQTAMNEYRRRNDPYERMSNFYTA